MRKLQPRGGTDRERGAPRKEPSARPAGGAGIDVPVDGESGVWWRWLDLFFNRTRSCLALLDGSGRFIRVNRAFAQHFGRAVEEFVGRAVTEFFALAGMRGAANPSALDELLHDGGQMHERARLRERSAAVERGAPIRHWILEPIPDGIDRVRGLILFAVEASELIRLAIASAQREAVYRQAVAAMAEGVVVQGPSGHITTVNPAAETILGRSGAQLLGQTIEALGPTVREDGTPLPLDQHPAAITLHTAASQSDVIVGLNRPDGARVWLSVNSQPALSEPSGPQAVVTTFRDITERRRIEDALSFIAQRGWLGTAENFLAALAQYLAQALNVDYVLIDRLADEPGIAQTAALYVRGEVAPNITYALEGTPCENVVGGELCVHPQGVQALFPRDRLLAQMGVESYAGMPLWDSAGRPIGLIAVMDRKPLSPSRPVVPLLRLVATRAAAELERERIERALGDRERLFRRLTESTPDKIARYSVDARTLYINPTLERTLGCTLQQLAGKTPTQNAATSVSSKYEQHILAVARTGDESEMELVCLGHDGREHYDSVRFVAERDETGAIIGVLAVGRDITARRRAEQERLAHLRFVENLDRVNSAMRGGGDSEHMLGDVLDTVLAMFECDRAWLVYPCNPDAATWFTPMEKTRPEYPGALVLGVPQPVDAQVAETFRTMLAAAGPVQFGEPGGEKPPDAVRARFGFKSFIAMVLRPNLGEPWLFGLHQCSHARTWTAQEEKLFQEIGRRLSDALNSLLMYRNLQKSEREFRSLAEHSPDVIARFDSEGRYLYVSPIVTQATGLAPEDYIGKPIGQTRRAAGHTISESSVGLLLDAVRRTVATGQLQLCEVAPSGEPAEGVLEYRMAPEVDAAGRLVSVLCIARDVTERKRNEDVQRRLNRSLRLLSSCNQLLVDAEDEPALLRDVCRLVVEAGDYLLAWVSVAEQDTDKTVRPIAHFGHDEGYLASIKVSWADVETGRGATGTAIRTGEAQISQDFLSDPRVTPWRQALAARGFRSSVALPLKDGHSTFGALTIFAGRVNAFFQEEVELLQELASDLAYGMRALRTRAEHLAAKAQLEFLAHHDSLTQLPNRLLLRDRFEQAVAVASRRQVRVAMLFLDLDGFKQINDSLGHEAGDQLLIHVARRLQSCVRSSDTVSREGGDEFVIVLSEVSGPDTAARVGQQILEAMEKPFEIGGNALQSALSIGISLYPDDGTDFETLRLNSDVALFHAKDGGRNTYRFFDEQMNRDTIERLQTQASLRSALKNGEFTLHYQPLVQLSDGRIVGVEALIRWRRDGELVLPGKFISAAEQGGLIIPIGEWVLDQACRQAVAWREAGLPQLAVAVNLSAVQFRRGNIVQAVAAALERSRLPATLLELELTESVLLHDTETAMQTLGALKKLGVKLSVDDFGTGYSSLSYLKRMAVDKLKIDQTFVRQLAQSPEDAAIVRAIVQLGHTLQLQVVAEGVETEAQLEFLKANGCDQIQGYCISRPMPAEEFAQFLRRQDGQG